MRRGQQDPRLRRRDQQQWGSCCTRQFGAATRKAIAWYGEHGGCCLFSHIVGVQQTTHLGQVLVLAFHLLSPPPELLDADSQSATLLDHLFLAIQPELVSGLEGRVRTGSRGGAEVVLVESDGERAVGGENEAGVAFAPVPGDVVSSGECQRKIYALDAGNVDWSGCCGFVDHVELGGGRGSGSKCEKRRQQLYGTRKTKHIPSQNPPNSSFISQVPPGFQLETQFCCSSSAACLIVMVISKVVPPLPVCQTRSQCIVINIPQHITSSQTCFGADIEEFFKEQMGKNQLSKLKTWAEIIFMQIR